MKVQLNHGGGSCFPLHFDGDPALDDRRVTGILYLNPDHGPDDGGELQLVPFPAPPVDVAPKFDRLILFSSQDMLHRVLPSRAPRICVTLWFYETAPGRPAAARAAPDDPLGGAAGRRLAARYFYRDAWATSIVEAHEPSAARDEALRVHAADVRRIAAELERRGVDLASLDRGDAPAAWFS